MALKEFKDYPNTETPIDAENLNFNFNEIFNLVFPIGKVEIFFDNEDHSNYMGFTWERTSIGKVPVGINTSDTDFNTIGKTGGEKKHTLTIAEMPSHNHNLSKYWSTAAGGNAAMGSNATGSSAVNANGISNTGGGGSHNNLQPYEVMAFWKRIS